MEKKINIAELLKDCPQGMELDCPIYENLYFDCICEHKIYPIVCYTIDSKGEKNKTSFNWYGKHTPVDTAKCVIFPKGKTTWEGFIPPCKFKDGDILATDLGSVFYLNTRLNTDECYGCYVGIGGDGSFHICEPFAYKECCGLSTEEEKQKLFDAIKANGYKWNEETKTLEKLTKFKVGDEIRGKYTGNIYTISHITLTGYKLTDGTSFDFDYECSFELILNKFDITTLKPFDKVLVKSGSLNKWHIQLFEKYDKTCKYPFICMGYGKYKECIPYEGNEHLLDTTEDCDEYYKTWE